MTFGRFISGKCNSAVTIKAIWPEKKERVLAARWNLSQSRQY